MNSSTRVQCSRVLPAHEYASDLSNSFANYFQEKVDKIYCGLKSNQSCVVDINIVVECSLSGYN